MCFAVASTTMAITMVIAIAVVVSAADSIKHMTISCLGCHLRLDLQLHCDEQHRG